MIKKKLQGFLGVAFATLVVAGAASTAHAYQMVQSSLGRYEAYIEPLYNSYGSKIGIKVHYSLGNLRDQFGRPSHYAAVCVKDTMWGNSCLEHESRVWTRNTSHYSVGYWLTQNVLMDCNGAGQVQVQQPYIAGGSYLNFSVYGGSPYQGSQLFYSGSSDVANIPVMGCDRLYP